jgi:hypothetical protein
MVAYKFVQPGVNNPKINLEKYTTILPSVTTDQLRIGTGGRHL